MVRQTNFYKGTTDYIGTAAERVAIASGLVAFDTFKETDTGLEYEYNGSAWFAPANFNLISSTRTIEIMTHFPKNTAAGTEQTAVQIPKPTVPVLMYKAAMSNSSIDSALTVKLFNRRTFRITGTAQAGGDSTHIVLAATANPTNDHYNGFVINILTGLGAGQTAVISDYVGATVTAEVPAQVATPNATSTYEILLVRDSLVWTWSFAKAVLTAPIVKANDSEIITGLFDNGCDVYYVVSNDTLIANADASRFTAVFQLIPVA